MKIHVTQEVSEDERYKLMRITAHAAWWSAFILTVLRTAHIGPISLGVIIVFLIGVGIASGLALSRMRLTRVITQVFKTGMAIQLQAIEHNDDDDPDDPPHDETEEPEVK